MITAAADKVVGCRILVGKPGNNNAPFAAICANRKTIGNAINHRRKPRSEIEMIHKKRYIRVKRKNPQGGTLPLRGGHSLRLSPGVQLIQRTLPPSGRVTTLVPFPFFFRRAFIVVEIKIKHKNYRIVKKLDTKTRKTFTSNNKVCYFRVFDIK